MWTLLFTSNFTYRVIVIEYLHLQPVRKKVYEELIKPFSLIFYSQGECGQIFYSKKFQLVSKLGLGSW